MPLLLVRVGGMGPKTGVLESRATGCSGGIGRAGKVEELQWCLGGARAVGKKLILRKTSMSVHPGKKRLKERLL